MCQMENQQEGTALRWSSAIPSISLALWEAAVRGLQLICTLYLPKIILAVVKFNNKNASKKWAKINYLTSAELGIDQQQAFLSVLAKRKPRQVGNLNIK